ncbi:DUF1496 domain-containing protein [Pseudoalteromonas sp. S3785]|uniref:DUF1496 domain-containing protein n=1 Tax=Pseudoalteromonas sp. S3785 TaxID=579545 RepID=UPI00110A8D97|nr:DUF1496 domain-containing protein [Pseudoalteromonas sp. S3785]
MRHIMVLFIFTIALTLSPSSDAKTVKTHSIIDTNEVINAGNICWYDNKRYSEGAPVQVHSFTLVCAASNPQHNNSKLIWLKLDKKGNLVYPIKPKTIRVN